MASKGVNKVILIGNLGADPETRYTAGGDAVTTLRIATGETWKDKQSGQTQERTEWHRVVMFGRLAEIAAEYLKKGSRVYIEGQLRTSKWQDQAGNTRYTTQIMAREMQMLSRVGDRNRDPIDDAQTPEMSETEAAAPQTSTSTDTVLEEDDIPF